MNPNQLVPCDGCTRHVRRSEAACPFCGLASPLASAAAVPPEPASRLSRAGILAFVATVGASACSSPQSPPPVAYEAQTPPADGGAPVTPVATPEPSPATPDASTAATTPARPEPGSMMLRYGAPPRP